MNPLITALKLRIKKSPYRKLGISWIVEKTIKHRTSVGPKRIKILGKVVNYLRDEEIVHCLKEIFFEQAYSFETSNPNPYIIDCGSHIGMSILFYKLKYPNAIIVGFEPDNSNFELLHQNVKAWNFENVSLMNQPVWISEEIVGFNASGAMGGRIEKSKDSGNSIIPFKAARLSSLLNKKVDFLKIDIEGSEYEIIKDCEQKLNFVENLFIEFHSTHKEQHKLIEILSILEKCKFDFYIKEANNIYAIPFNKKKSNSPFDLQLNIFAFRNA